MSNLLYKQLNNLRNEIKPDVLWQERSREILLMQIRQGVAEKEAQWFTFIETIWMQKILVQMTRPMALAAMVLVVVFGGSVMSIKAANQTKPGDALYIAKIINEKAQFALTFDNTKKAKLNLAFAANRTNELKKLELTKQENKEHDETVKDLKAEIKTELDEAQTRIAKLAPVPEPKPTQAQAMQTGKKQSEEPKASIKQETAKISSAAIDKDKSGLDYYDPRQAALEKVKISLDKGDYDATATQLIALSKAMEEPVKLDVDKNASSSDIKTEQLEKSTTTKEKDKE